MLLRRVVSVFLALVFTCLIAFAQQRDRQGQQPAATPSATPAATGEAAARPASEPRREVREIPEAAPVVTHHEVRVGGKTLRYTATAGMMPLKNNDTGEVEAHIFYIAYTLDGQAPERRPLTFSFNGGPGSASVWLHLGAIGPKRVRMQPDGMMPAPPYQLVDNEYTWLDQTDLVFIDPVGT